MKYKQIIYTQTYRKIKWKKLLTERSMNKVIKYLERALLLEVKL